MADRRAFTVENLDPKSLKAHDLNFRRHPEAQRKALAASLAEFGYVAAPIVNRRTGMTIIDGHARVELALESGETSIPVNVVDLSLAKEERLLRSFDRIATMAEIDTEALDALIEQIDDAALEQLLGEVAEPQSGLLPEADPDAIPENVETRCRPGDLWRLGSHRLLCGDSTKREDVERLLDSKRMALLFTSPPYLNQRHYERGVGDWDVLMQGVFSRVPEDAGQILVNLGLVHREGEWLPYWDGWIEWMRENGWRRFGFYVWDQGPGLPGDWNGRLAPSHEFVFHFNREAERARKTKDCKGAGEKRRSAQKGLRQSDGSVAEYSHTGRLVQDHKIPDSVFRIMRHKARGIEVTHPAIYPVDLASEVVEAFSDPGDGVYDPFLGSGSTLIACEETGRACCGMEIEARYCDVILARYEQATGKQAEKL